MKSRLKIVNLTKSFSSQGKRTVALADISVSFPDKYICGLLGMNGAGKTTLIKCVAGLVTPDSGDIFVGDESLLRNRKARFQNISVVLDGGRNLFPYMTVKENLQYFSFLRSGHRRDLDDDVLDIFETLKIKNIINKQIQKLSYGMRQRASIAIALACRSHIIFLDEPTTGLDIFYQEELSALLKLLQSKYNCSIIVSSHDMRFVEKTCTYCVLLDHGKLIKSGKIDEFRQSFDMIQYELKLGSNIEESTMALLQSHLYINSFDSDNRTLSIMWPRSQDFCKMIDLLGRSNIIVREVNKVDDLTAAIASLTRSRLEVNNETDNCGSI